MFLAAGRKDCAPGGQILCAEIQTWPDSLPFCLWWKSLRYAVWVQVPPLARWRFNSFRASCTEDITPSSSLARDYCHSRYVGPLGNNLYAFFGYFMQHLPKMHWAGVTTVKPSWPSVTSTPTKPWQFSDVFRPRRSAVGHKRAFIWLISAGALSALLSLERRHLCHLVRMSTSECCNAEKVLGGNGSKGPLGSKLKSLFTVYEPSSCGINRAQPSRILGLGSQKEYCASLCAWCPESTRKRTYAPHMLTSAVDPGCVKTSIWL